MRRISLYIAGRKVDFDEDSFLLFNYTQEDLSNPTIVKNSFSQSVTIKGTPNNNRIFGDIFRADRKTLRSSQDFGGVSFDPRRKTPFTIYSETSEVLESGYCKLEGVNDDRGSITYEVAFFGGLGSFLYALTNAEDGTPLTLADLIYRDVDDRDTTSFPIRCLNVDVEDAWSYLEDGEVGVYPFWNILNFCPSYDGLPSDFDCSHAIIGTNFDNVKATQTKDGDTYTWKTGQTRALCAFTNPHTGWELCDLRWYLQRPCISLKSVIEAVCDPRNNGGYEVILDASFFNADNHLFNRGWMTLPLIATEDRNNQYCLDNVLKGTKTPADYLTSFAKVFGLLFVCDSSLKRVSIMTRQTFYSKYAGENPVDLTERVHRGGRKASPLMADNHFYQFGGKCIGETADLYRRNFGTDYGIAKVDTGYQFDSETKELTKDIAFRDALEAEERNLMFTSWAIQPDGQGGWERYFSLPRLEAVTYQLWNGDKSADFDIECAVPAAYMDNADLDYADWLPKLQLHDADNKAVDGSNVLCVYEGMRDTPIYATSPTTQGKEYYLTNDLPAMTALLGKPCWDLSMSQTAVTALPSFRRHHLEGNFITETFEWGKPLARPVINIDYPADNDMSIYARFWQTYLADRYDVDGQAKVVKVNLRGMQVGRDLMRKFFWYEGAVWVINRIINHSLTTDDLTEVELIKVKDRNAYLLGTTSPDTEYLIISPSTLSQSLPAEGGTAIFTISSSSGWRLRDWTSGLSFNRQEGDAGVMRLEVGWSANGQSTMRSAYVTIENLDGISMTLTIVQAGASIVDTREIAFNGISQSISKNAGSITADITCTSGMSASDVSVVSSESWVSGLSVSLVNATTLRVTGSVSANSDVQRSATLTATIVGTNKNTTQTIIQAQGAVTAFYVRPENVTTIPYLANTQVIEIGAVTNWTASVYTDQTGGASLDITSGGAGRNYINLSVPRNSTSSTRTINVRVASGGSTRYVTFQQEVNGASGSYILPSSNRVTLGAKVSQTQSVTINTSGIWEVYSKPSWLQATSNGYGSGQHTLTFTTLSANYTQNAREDVVVLRLTGNHSVTASISVVQSASYVLPSTTSATLAKNGTAFSVPVTSSSAWQVVSTSQTWLTAVKDGNNLVLSATANSGSTTRNGNVVISLVNDLSCTATINVAQIATDGQQGDGIAVGIASLVFAPEGESKQIMVYATGAWTLSLPSWITATYTTRVGNPNGEMVTLEATRNTSADRTHTLVFSLTGTAETAEVEASQDVVGILTLATSSFSIGHKSQNISVTFQANCNWRVGSYTQGMVTPPSVISGNGNGSLTFAISKNYSTSERLGSITIEYGSGYTSTAIVSIEQGVASISISPVSGEYAREGGSKSVVVTANDSFHANTDQDWLTANFSSMQEGVQSGTIVASPARVTQVETGVLIFTIEGTGVRCLFNAVQEAALPSLSLSAHSWDVDWEERTQTFDITSNTEWEIVDITEGLSFNLTSGRLSTQNAWTIQENTSLLTKNYSATIRTRHGSNDVTLTITIQQGINSTTIYVSTELLEFNPSHTSGRFFVQSDKAWEAWVSQPWIHISRDNGVANELYEVQVNVDASMSQELTGMIGIRSGFSYKYITIKSYPIQ